MNIAGRDFTRAGVAARRLLAETERSPGLQESATGLADSIVREAECCLIEVAEALGRPGAAIAYRAALATEEAHAECARLHEEDRTNGILSECDCDCDRCH